MAARRTEPGWELERDGVEVVPGLVRGADLVALRGTAPPGGAGVRNPLRAWEAGRLAALAARAAVVERVGGPALLTRAILFDKRADANWHLPLHRDLAVAVLERVDVPGFGPWSIKDGVPHVRPPTSVLSRMLTARIHLDAADQENGCLRFVPGSHIDAQRQEAPDHEREAMPVEVGAGDVVLMRPLVLHGSERNRSGAGRRVLHLEFAFEPLPPPLAWATVSMD